VIRDIRDDLIDRLNSLDARHMQAMMAFAQRYEEMQREHRKEVEAIGREREAIKAMLALEDDRLGEGRGASRAAERSLMPLGEFIITTLCARGPMEREDIKIEANAAGYFGNGANGRTFNTTLMNLVKHGKLLSHGTVYSARGVPSYPLFQSESVADGDRPLM
jgi:hypothetical protein